MEPKKIKKLVLKQEIIANLDNNEMNHQRGGATGPVWSCEGNYCTGDPSEPVWLCDFWDTVLGECISKNCVPYSNYCDSEYCHDSLVELCIS